MMNVGKIAGVVVFAGATAAIWVWPKGGIPEVPEEILRPVRSCVVEGGVTLPEMRFAGKVKATESRTLCFKHSGRVERIPVSKGQTVKKGEKLAWLFAEDFADRVEEAAAAAERDRLSFRRVSDAAKKNAVSREELSRAEAQLRQSEANLELARRALAETVLTAPFDATVADIPASELDMVSAADRIVVLLDLSKIKIDVIVPETLAIMQRKIRHEGADGDECKVSVFFDSCPDRMFSAQFVEYTGEADKSTQTYTATYVMDPVADLLLLPGMSATAVIPAGSYSFRNDSGDEGIDIPESAVGVDGSGGYFVWKLVREGDVYVAHKSAISGCTLGGRTMRVGSGVAVGDRIATAGIAVLTEGRKVSLMED